MPPNDDGARRSVLLVEDNLPDARIVREGLESEIHAGVVLRHCVRLRDALREISESPPWCVLLDLSLPDADGLEALVRLRAVAADTPIVVLTGQSDEALGLMAAQRGADDYLLKGRLDRFQLRAAVTHAVERRRAQTQLVHDAMHDGLTGLANRHLFVDRLAHALTRLTRQGRGVAILFVDLDGFKVVNDGIDHAAGDRVLVEVAQRLRRIVRPGDSIARFGGDEFVVLCEGVDDPRAVSGVAQRVLSALSIPFEVGIREVFLGASVGIAFANGSSIAPQDLIRDADIAMYRAKKLGRNRIEIFDEDMRSALVRRMEMADSLRVAARTGAFEVVYQPEVRISDGRIVGAEALLRWRRPDGSWILPADFIPVAEGSGIMPDITCWVLREACRTAAGWRREDHGAEAPMVAVNVSPSELGRPGLVEAVSAALAETAMDPSRLTLEITESALVHETANVRRTFEELKGMGVRLSIDDFGTGYSSLGLLRRISVDVIKVDRSLIAQLESDPRDRAIVAAIVQLSRAMGVEAVAEGVESAGQVAWVRELGCDIAQGFYLAPPLSAGDVEGTIASDGGRWAGRPSA